MQYTYSNVLYTYTLTTVTLYVSNTEFSVNAQLNHSLCEESWRKDGFIVGSIQQSKACKGMRGSAQDRAAT